MHEFDVIVVGSGWAGSIVANSMAENGSKVCVVEKRNHIAGNMYDYWDENNLLIHKYGPHIVMTDNKKIVDFIRQYDDIFNIQVKMETYINGKVVPLPINLNSIDTIYGDDNLRMQLVNQYGGGGSQCFRTVKLF